MADWKTYAKAARNTARKQAPGARDAARRASGRAGDYVRAAGRAIDEGGREEHPEDRDRPRDREDSRSPRDPAPREGRDAPAGDRTTPRGDRTTPRGDRPAPRSDGTTRTSTAERPSGDTAARSSLDGDRLRRDAAAYYTVAKRRADSANIGPRIMRALRDALLIGLSLFVIWGVLAAAGIPIPFTTVLIIVALIVAVSFGGGLYAQWKRSRDLQEEADEDPREP